MSARFFNFKKTLTGELAHISGNWVGSESTRRFPVALEEETARLISIKELRSGKWKSGCSQNRFDHDWALLRGQ